MHSLEPIQIANANCAEVGRWAEGHLNGGLCGRRLELKWGVAASTATAKINIMSYTCIAVCGVICNSMRVCQSGVCVCVYGSVISNALEEIILVILI